MTKPIRFVAVADNHGDMQDKHATSGALAFVKEFKPTVRIHLGDCFDFRHLRKGAEDGEMLDSVAEDFEQGMEFLTSFAPTVFLWGNHDHRLHKVMRDPAKDGALKFLCGQWIDRIETFTKKAQHFPYDKRRGVYQLGDTRFLHGYAHGVNAVRQSTLVYGSMVMGHIHTQSTIQVEGIPGRTGYSCGCLCGLDPSYAETALRTLTWKNGWIYGFVEDGITTVFHAQKVGNRWVAPGL